MRKKIGYLILILVIGIQFIRPARNLGNTTGPNEIGLKYAIPQEVSKILEKSCYDCHSNHTDYPWYTNIQPVGWWMQWHVNEGKRHLNYTEFASYEPKRARGKFKETVDQVKGDEMPLNSYLWIHRDEILSDSQKQILVIWADSLQHQLTRQYNLPPPEDNRQR